MMKRLGENDTQTLLEIFRKAWAEGDSTRLENRVLVPIYI
jgi:hypothetical protein